MTRQRWTEGAYVKIPLHDGTLSVGRLLKKPNVAFYDAFFQNREMYETTNLKIAFITCVYVTLIHKGIWEVSETRPLEGELLAPPKYFKVDPIKGNYSLYAEGKEFPATREDCIGHERLAVWDESHIVDRLLDLGKRVPNKWAESLKP